MFIDHVILGTADLEGAGRRLLDEHGLASVPGGTHADWGTANRIVPLGRSYLEIVGIVDEQRARTNFYGKHVLKHTTHGDRLIGWCVASDNIEETASRLGIDAVPGSRMLPDGDVVRWRTAGAEEALASGYLPFFIEWDVPPQLHPGRMHADHGVKPREILSVSIAGDAEALGTWLGGGIPPWVEVLEGPGGGVHSVKIALSRDSDGPEVITLLG